MISKRELKSNYYLLRTLFYVVVSLTILIFGAVTYFVKWEEDLKDKIYPNVYINDVNFGSKKKSDVYEFFLRKNNRLSNLRVEIIFNDERVATFSGKALKLGYNSKEIADKAFLIGRSTNLRSRVYQKFMLLTHLKRYKLREDFTYSLESVNEFLSEMSERYNKEPQNALFKFEKGKVVAFKKDKKGEKIDAALFLRDFDNTIRRLVAENGEKGVVVLHKIEVKPEIKLSDINEFGIRELIGKGTSEFFHSARSRVHNIVLAASRFNGVLIPPNKEFSFNKTIGDISVKTGYMQAYIIKNGRTILGDGGGVCQVSTTLFRAALNAGLPITERHAHAYRVSYYEEDSPPGLDATVFAPSVDLRFKNNTPSYILIQTKINLRKRKLSFELYGEKDGRMVYLSKPVVWGISPPPPPLYQDDPTLPRGVTKQIDFASYGAKVYFDYKVKKGDTTIFSKRFYSFYKPWQAIYLVGTGENVLIN